MRPSESFTRQPIRSLQTMLRVLSKDDASLPTVIPDGIYGPLTMQAVSTFQRKYGLPVTGIVNQQTWEAVIGKYEPALIRVSKAEPIEIILEPGQTFKRGDSSPYIYLLQAMLTQLSNDHPTIESPGISGIIDETTAASILGFQQLAGLDMTGEIDKITWKHLVKQFTLNANHHNQGIQ